jgi:aryl-alcohol dehydrogenase-like predicted oxidoreductase
MHIEHQSARLLNDYDIPRIIVGAWQFSAGHNVDPGDTDGALETLAAFADAGLSTFDCADIYTGVEELLGEFLNRRSRDVRAKNHPHVQVHTKFVPDRDALQNISKAYTERIIDRSLQRLGLEQLDLVQFAWWDYTVPGYVETACWLRELQLAGKIRHLGVTNCDVPRLREIVGADVQVVSHQVQYSLLDHRPEHGLVEFCRERDISLLCYGTVAGGFLSGRWLGKSEPSKKLENRSLTKYKLMIDEFGGWEAFQELLQSLHDIATKHSVSIATVATRYVLQMPQVAAAIVGARSTKHLQDSLNTISLELDESDISRLREFSVPRSAEGDVYALEREPDSTHASIMRYNLNRKDAN